MRNAPYFVVMADYGPRGFEAIVDPHHSRADAINLVRERLGDGIPVSFVHEIIPDERVMNDVTEEIAREIYDAMDADELASINSTFRDFIEYNLEIFTRVIGPEEIADMRREMA